MAGEDLLTYSGAASVAYKDAVDAATRNAKALFNQYYGNVPDFDFGSVFNKETGEVSKNALNQFTSGLVSSGKGVFADIGRGGASAEADVASEFRARGFDGGIGGGLAAQRRGLVESMTAKQTGAAKSQFLAGIGEAVSPVGASWQDLQAAMIQDQLTAGEAGASGYASTSDVVPPASAPSWADASQYNPKDFTKRGQPGDKPGKPQNPNQVSVHRGPGGIVWLWRPSQQGWFKK